MKIKAKGRHVYIKKRKRARVKRGSEHRVATGNLKGNVIGPPTYHVALVPGPPKPTVPLMLYRHGTVCAYISLIYEFLTSKEFVNLS